jgi:hypothetical protein
MTGISFRKTYDISMLIPDFAKAQKMTALLDQFIAQNSKDSDVSYIRENDLLKIKVTDPLGKLGSVREKIRRLCVAENDYAENVSGFVHSYRLKLDKSAMEDIVEFLAAVKPVKEPGCKMSFGLNSDPMQQSFLKITLPSKLKETASDLINQFLTENELPTLVDTNSTYFFRLKTEAEAFRTIRHNLRTHNAVILSEDGSNFTANFHFHKLEDEKAFKLSLENFRRSL